MRRPRRARACCSGAIERPAEPGRTRGGASALQEDRRLDRHWRNARTLASHNPTIYKGRVVGDHLLNGARPTFYWAVGAIAS